MRIEIPTRIERLGAVRINDLQRVFELDSGRNGHRDDPTLEAAQLIRCIPSEVSNDIEKRMAIVLPCRQERLKILEGVLTGIPHDCLTILVSNSSRGPVDRFQMERETLSHFCRLVQRSAILVHQRDPGLAEAFDRAGYSDVLDEKGLVRHGKAEGMLIGTVIARLCGKEFVGFIDADNYVPGAVNEYVKEYAAAFHLAQTPYAMVRISWHSKPKIQESRLFFSRWGRVSETTNRFLNRVLAHYTGFGTEIVKTGNAGEHAFSLALGGHLSFASGFAVEPYELINLLELFGGIHPSPYPNIMKYGVEVFQVETRNPHFHEDKGDDHVHDMRAVALDVLYHSPICPPPIAEEIREFLHAHEALPDGEEPDKVRIYPPPNRMNLDAFLRVLVQSGESFEQVLEVAARPVLVEPPIPVPDYSESDGLVSCPQGRVLGPPALPG